MGLLSVWTLAILLSIGIHKTDAFDGCLCVEKFADGLQLPVDLVNANDGSNRIFVAELKGITSVYYANGTKLPEPLIDVTKKTGYIGKIAETGLTSLAFHPHFKSNGLFYALVSTQSKMKGVDHNSNLFEFKISSTDKNKADPSYARKLLTFSQPVWTHNADQLLFGTDNFLYVFIGDGGHQGDPNMWAQNMNKYYGKVLRIDVDSRTGNLPYGIPKDNPFNNGLPEIYALGVRNPWRGGMDRGDRLTGEGRGRIIFGDVGQDSVEELDLLEKGANYEWNIKEATQSHCSKSNCLKGPGKFTPPIYSYNRNTKLGKSIIGGQFYRGCRSPKLNGIYFWGDYYSGLLFRLKENKATGTWQNKQVTMCQSNVCKSPLQSSFEGHMTSFGLDEEGEVYMVTSVGRQVYKTHGHIYKLVEPSQPGDPEPCRVSSTTEIKPKIQTLRKQIKNINIPRPNKSVAKILNKGQLKKKQSDSKPVNKIVKSKPPAPQEPATTKAKAQPTSKTLEKLNQGKEGASILTNTKKENSAEIALGKDKGKSESDSAPVNGNTGGQGQENEEKSKKDDVADEAGQEDPAPSTETSNGYVKSKLNTILDTITTGSDNLKGTLANFLGKLLARLYYADFSSQDGDTGNEK